MALCRDDVSFRRLAMRARRKVAGPDNSSRRVFHILSLPETVDVFRLGLLSGWFWPSCHKRPGTGMPAISPVKEIWLTFPHLHRISNVSGLARSLPKRLMDHVAQLDLLCDLVPPIFNERLKILTHLRLVEVWKQDRPSGHAVFFTYAIHRSGQSILASSRRGLGAFLDLGKHSVCRNYKSAVRARGCRWVPRSPRSQPLQQMSASICHAHACLILKDQSETGAVLHRSPAFPAADLVRGWSG